jgi:hypothetical protein
MYKHVRILPRIADQEAGPADTTHALIRQALIVEVLNDGLGAFLFNLNIDRSGKDLTK